MELGTFEKGYSAGRRSVRGPKDLSANVPASPMRIPAGSYMVGFSCALRDATAMDETRGLESWNVQGGGGAIRILTRGPGSSLGFPDPKPPSDKKRIAPHAGHR
jgi:hypothetical protein